MRPVSEILVSRDRQREMAMLKKGLSYRRQGSSGLIWADNMIVAEDGTLILNRHNNNNNNVSNNLNVHGEGGFAKISAEPRRGSEASELSQIMMMSRSKSVGSNSSMAASEAISSSAPVPAQAPAMAMAMAAPPTPTTAPARHKSSFRVMKWLKKAITKIRR